MTILGVTCRPEVPPERLKEVVRAAEDGGLDELWLWEDCFWGGAASAAAAALAWTSRLRVGIGVLPVPLRNVALTAMETAMLHRLFPGRVTVGVGHGVQSWMEQAGARAESPLTLLREYLDALRALLRGERVTVHGRYVHLEDVALGWPPATAPAILAAAAGPRTLRLSGELADGTVLDSSTTPGQLRSAREAIDAGRAAAGRADPHPVVLYLQAAPAPGPAPVTAPGPAPATAPGTAPVTAPGTAPVTAPGTADPPESAAVAGDAGAIAAAVRFWAGAGADAVILHPPAGVPDPAAFVRFTAEKVRPLLVDI